MTNEERAAAYLKEFPDCDPKNSPVMRAAVNSSDYVDRGMWGPLGGPLGTMSQVWLDENTRLEAGGASELGLMTVVEPPGEEE